MNDQFEPSPAFKGVMMGIAFGLLVFASMVSGSAHASGWWKTAEWQAQDPYGNAIVVCQWTNSRGQVTQTQGMSFCPYP